MKVIVKARHMTLTPALTEHAEEKLGHAIARIFDRPDVKIEIELSELGRSNDGLNKECRVTVFMPHGKAINIVEKAEDMYKAVDLAHDRVVNQVKRQREKKRVVSRTGKGTRRAAAAPATESETWEKEVQEFESSTPEA
ncbi:MAG: ribosome-associated translation inhibitor RaiA [Deltaproteobacteria bacterium]|nr:ribosome-associated translation inhibitor RaiA [Deltaproteobacteria bacterium]